MPDSKPTDGQAPKTPSIPSPPLPPIPKPGAEKTAAPPVPSPPLPPVTPATPTTKEESGSTYSWSLDDDKPKEPPAAPPTPATKPTETPAAGAPSPSRRPAPSQPTNKAPARTAAQPGAADTSPAPRTPSLPRTPSAPRTPPLPRTAKPAAPAAPSPAVPQSSSFPVGESDPARRPAAAPTFSRGHRQEPSDWAEDVENLAPAAGVVTAGGLFFGALSLGFLVFAIATGRFATLSEVSNVTTAAAVLNLCMAAASIGFIITQWRSRAMGGMIAAVGFALLVIAPAVLPEAVSSAVSFFRGGGVFLLAVGLAKIGLDVALGGSSSASRGSTHSRTSTAGRPTAPMPMAAGQALPTGTLPKENSSAATAPATPGRHVVPTPVSEGSEIIEDDPQLSWLQRMIDALEPVGAWMFRVGAVAGVLSLAYILYAIFMGRIGQPGVAPQLVNNLGLAATIFTWSAVFIAISGIIFAIDVKAFGSALAAIGFALHFGSSWVIFNFVGTTAATTAIVTGLRNAGAFLIVLGVLKACYDLYRWMVELPERNKQRADVGVGTKAEAAQQRVAREANALSPCWKLPFCREVIRKQCPAFLAKKTCWKFGRGCYCDEEMISRIIRGESLEVIKAPTRLSKTGKPPCGRCHIYLEHQGFKFKMLSPLALPATIVVMYFIWPYWEMLFSAFSNAPLWDALSFDTAKLAPEAIATKEPVDTGGGLPAEQVIHVATIMFGVLIGFFVLIYMSKFIEWAVYKAKL